MQVASAASTVDTLASRLEAYKRALEGLQGEGHLFRRHQVKALREAARAQEQHLLRLIGGADSKQALVVWRVAVDATRHGWHSTQDLIQACRQRLYQLRNAL